MQLNFDCVQFSSNDGTMMASKLSTSQSYQLLSHFLSPFYFSILTNKLSKNSIVRRCIENPKIVCVVAVESDIQRSSGFRTFGT